MAILAGGCAVDHASKQEERAPTADPLVRERTLGRMDEIAAPARTATESNKAKLAKKDCDGVCESVKDICDRADRVCVLAEDFPASDADVHERCEWSTSDCNESRGLCANCGGASGGGEY